MNYTPTLRSNDYNFIREFEDDVNKKVRLGRQNEQFASFQCPHIAINVNGNKVWALLDTGSQITCISESFYEKISKIM